MVSCGYSKRKHRRTKTLLIAPSGADSLVCPYKDRERACLLRKPERQENGKTDGMKRAKYRKHCKRDTNLLCSEQSQLMRFSRRLGV